MNVSLDRSREGGTERKTRERRDGGRGERGGRLARRARTSAPSVAKFALRMDGDTMTEFLSHASTFAFALTANVLTFFAATRLEVSAEPLSALRAKTAGEAVKADIVLEEESEAATLCGAK